MAKRQMAQIKKKGKKNETELTQYIRSQNPFDFQIAEEKSAYGTRKLFSVYYNDSGHSVRLLKGDSIEILNLARENSVDMIFADPPYFLSNGGITCQAGRMVSVDKGKWDRSKGINADLNLPFNGSALAQTIEDSENHAFLS